MTDHWKAYAEFLPEIIHTQSQAETYTVEGYNSILRHFMATGIRARFIHAYFIVDCKLVIGYGRK